MKIIIKKADLPSHANNNTPKGSSSEASITCPLTLLPFPKLAQQAKILSRVVALSPEEFEAEYSNAQDTNNNNSDTGRWTNNITSLSSELDSIRKSLKDFNSLLQSQLEILEQFKDGGQVSLTASSASVPIVPPPTQKISAAPVTKRGYVNSTCRVLFISNHSGNLKAQPKKRKSDSDDDQDCMCSAVGHASSLMLFS